jgi:diaminopimelate epimerase
VAARHGLASQTVAAHDERVEIEFLKMNGCGDDVVVVDCFRQPLAVQADLALLSRRCLHRGTGVGGNALLLVGPGSAGGSLSARAFQPDGAESDPSGHALRCAARYATDAGLVSSTEFAIETRRGDVRAQAIDSRNIRLDLGIPVSPEAAAEIHESPAAAFTVSLEVGGRLLSYMPVSVGTPFGIFFVPGFDSSTERAARRIARHAGFPAGTGVAFAQVIDRETLGLRAWDRARRVPSCSCAAAAVVAAVVNGFCDREVFVRLPGCDLFLEWREETNRLHLTGPALYAFTGTYPFEE